MVRRTKWRFVDARSSTRGDDPATRERGVRIPRGRPNGPKWRTGILDIAHVSGTGVGATYKQGVKGPGGRRIDADYRVTAEPNSRLAFEAIAGPVRPKGEYVLDEVDGGTRLTFSLHAELGIKKLLMGGAVQKTMDRKSRRRNASRASLRRCRSGLG